MAEDGRKPPAYTTEEVDAVVHALEKKTERQIATRNSAVKGVAAERDVLSAAEAARDLLVKAVKGEKEYLDKVFGGTCERIGRCRLCLDRVEFSDMHAKDQRWRHLRDAVDTVEAVLKELGTFRPWVPQLIQAPSKIVYKGVRRRISPGRRVSLKVEIEGGEAEFFVEPALPLGLELNPTTGIIFGTVAPGVVPPEEVTYVVTARNDSGEASVDVTFAVAEVPPTSLRYPAARSELFAGEVVRWQAEVEGGTPTDWSVSPCFPAALQLDPSSGVISGSCQEAVDEAEYVVSAANDGGKAVTTLHLMVRIKPPTALQYKQFAEVVVLELGEHVEFHPEDNIPGLTFSVDPELPEGLQLDEVSGVIRGAPTAESSKTAYEVVAQNRGGEVTTAIEFEVRLLPPRSVGYPSAPARLLTGHAVELKPEAVGFVSAWSVSPNLPPGLDLDAATGIVSGTPFEVVDTGKWEVRASNDAGDCGCQLCFAVELSPPGELSFPSLEEEYALLKPVHIEPSFVGVVNEFSVSPALPDGLSLDSQSGVISGTPSVVTTETCYEVTARNSTGAATVSATFAVVVMPPSDLKYPHFRESFKALEVVNGEEDGRPEVLGGATSFAVEPALPEGLQLDAATGVISGAAAAPADSTTYTVTASNEAGSTSFDLTFVVVVPPPSELTYPMASQYYVVGDQLVIEPDMDDYTAGCTYSAKPPLPEGLSIDAQTGVISGIPESVCDETTYVITAKNKSGSSKFDLTFQILNSVAETIDAHFADLIEAVTDLAELLPEPSRAKQFGDWMIWMVHRAFLDDPELVDFNFNNMHMPPPHIEIRIAPKLMQALHTNTHIETLNLSNSNMMKAQGHELAEALATNTTLKTVNVESNNLDSSAVREIAEAISKNTGSRLENLRVCQQRQVGQFFGRPVEEAVGQMMEKNETIIRLGFECNDAHWRNLIDRALLRNNDFHRRRKRKSAFNEEEIVAEEKSLSRLVLLTKPEKGASEVFAEAAPESKAFLAFVGRFKKLPTGSQLQSFAKNEGTPVKYSTVAPLIKECRSRILDTAVNMQVTVADAFEVDTHGTMRSWSEQNGNWSLDLWTPDGKRYAYKSSKEPVFSVSEEYAEWLQ